MKNLWVKSFKTQSVAVAVVFGVTVLGTSAYAQTDAVKSTPAQVAGVGNFHVVNDHIYRGAQPTAAGFQGLAKAGVKTIIDLRETDARSAVEKKAVEAAGMRYINIPMRGMSAPSTADVEKIMALFNDASSGPVFVHCRRGADRTGTVVACYRIAHDGWDNAKALREARTDGMRWVEISMQHYVMGYQPSAATVAATTAAAQQ
jgi:tyrosine-protein phosphatase SIW14